MRGMRARDKTTGGVGLADFSDHYVFRFPLFITSEKAKMNQNGHGPDIS
jgi:hypothetical protein